MDLPDRIREAIASGRLREPFSARDVVRALSGTWTVARVHSFLVRHCSGNLAASVVIVERVSYGRYRLLSDGPRGGPTTPHPFRRNPFASSDSREDPNLPGDPES